MTEKVKSIEQAATQAGKQTYFISKKRLTKPILSITQATTYTVKIVGEMYKKSLPVAGKVGTEVETTMIDVVNMDRNEECSLICNAIIESAFHRCEPPLVGRYFEIHIGEIRAGKRYRDVDIYELEPGK